MKRFLLVFWLVGIIAPLAALAAVNARNADVPVITSLLEQRDGTRIKLSFLAVHWDADMMASLKTSKEMRDYFNTYLAPKMGILETNVKLRFGPRMQIDTGVFFLGVKVNEPLAADQPPTWSLLISDSDRVWITLPMNIVEGNAVQEHLSFVFTPGITDRDFLFHWIFGNLSASVRWTMIGIPSKTADSAAGIPTAWDLPQPGTADVPAPDDIQSATFIRRMVSPGNAILKDATSSTRAKKVGSGSLRYLDDLQKKEKNNPSTQPNEKDNK